MTNETPFAQGYRMPAEWEPHDGTWIAWPKNHDSFPDDILPEVEDVYIEIISALHEGEEVHILVDDGTYEKRAIDILEAMGIRKNIAIHRIQTSDVWFRDYGPIFITKDVNKVRELAFTKWNFNAWGGKYEDLKRDNDVPNQMPLTGMGRFDAPMVLEGGSIDVNGLGTCITTEQCLLNKNRNAHLSKEMISENLSGYLGATNIIWLKEGIAGDDTDGHVDDVARFVNKNTIVCAVEEDPVNENYASLTANLEILEDEAVDQDGGKLKIVPIDMPSDVIMKGQRLPASYTNFYIGNRAVLVPIFDDNNDRDALNALKDLFPGRKVLGINCRELVYGLGAIHCITQQQPGAGPLIHLRH